ncbi:hypothetical protein PX52LOC_03500 [Limnoglobus roseus]|uniref:Uncharacterized protein n=1 Tax=Limnoglobus roseus TaxID=2598579 RepID=A0A5C1ACW4_9BACT|nr:hypothetical protein PX52LOC_03500 [Limnoglobus roseus]
MKKVNPELRQRIYELVNEFVQKVETEFQGESEDCVFPLMFRFFDLANQAYKDGKK